MNKFLGCLIFVLIAYQSIFAQMSCGISLGNAVNLPKPIYSESIKFTNDIEIVEVKVEINEQGSVTSAKTVSGNSAFATISQTAALNSKFKPSFPKIKYTGIIKYEFSLNTKSSKVSHSVDYNINELEKKANIECAKIYKTYTLQFKADKTILNLVDGLIQNRTEPNSDEIGFVINGKAKIGIKLKELNSKNIKELKSFGVEIIGKIASENAIIGQIPIEKIEALLELKNIVYVFPFWIKSPPKPVI